MPPEVTVVIPTLDRPALLRLALTSALAQRGVATEVVVVDDGSTPPVRPDGPLADPRVTLVRHGISLGMAAARNAGLRATGSPWVAFMDDDDAWAPDKLHLQLSALASRAARFAYAGALAVSPAGHVLARIPPPRTEDLHAQLLMRNVIPAGASNVLVETSLARALGGFDESLPHLADWDMWIRLAEAARAAAVRADLVAYRYHGANRSFRAAAPLRADFDVLADRYEGARRSIGIEVDRSDFERFLAWGPRHRGERLSAAAVYLRAGVRLRDVGSIARGLGMFLGERAMRRGAGRPRPQPLPPWARPFFDTGAGGPGQGAGHRR
jgi:glycosyltransferase involved in cell wall biosynthesis